MEDLRYLGLDGFQHFGEVAPPFIDYLNLRCQVHLHFGIRFGDLPGEERHYCSLLKAWPLGRVIPGDRFAVGEAYVRFESAENGSEEAKLPVLVVVTEGGESQKRIVGCVPSDVLVATLDEPNDAPVYTGKPSPLIGREAVRCLVDRELDVPPSPIWEWPAQTVTYELPSDVVEDAPVVVDRVAEAGRKECWKLGWIAGEDESAAVDCSDGIALVSYWLDTEGWSWVTAEEPACLAVRGSFVEVCPLELRFGAAKGRR
jgi:hypothetical protein